MKKLALVLALLLAGCSHAPKPTYTPPPTTTPQEPVPPSTPPTQAPPEFQPPSGARGRIDWLDVGIVIDADSARIGATAGASVQGVVEVTHLSAGQSLVARAASGRVLIQPVPGTRELAIYEVADTLVLVPDSPNSFVTIGAKPYRGELRLYRSPNGRVTVVNRVGTEEYLRGVLPHEIGRLDQRTIEAGKAQAVAARTYALSYVGRRADQGFDVYATVEDQLYGGITDEGPLTDRCVRETSQLVATYNGRLIRANYFSTCGGVTANVEDVWPESPLPWLRSTLDADHEGDTAYCAASPQFRWTEIWSVPEFLDIVNRNYPRFIGALPPGGAHRLDGVRVTARSPSGRVAELVIDTDIGPLPVHGDSTRRVLVRPASSQGAGGGGTLLRSSLFKIGIVRARDGVPIAVVATGAGYGHGVGLCQWGALEMARRGRDFHQILGHYFAGIEIKPANESKG
ncbi:MAG TPA: SpoIID/LytB domain-containing protein [Candidatus Eisenbacteria bacterium]|nr:SpoIID/LytB domain-containing protein [Candidatus Eisenbacteria bacterium]